jgi:hypothetical protein
VDGNQVSKVCSSCSPAVGCTQCGSKPPGLLVLNNVNASTGIANATLLLYNRCSQCNVALQCKTPESCATSNRFFAINSLNLGGCTECAKGENANSRPPACQYVGQDVQSASGLRGGLLTPACCPQHWPIQPPTDLCPSRHPCCLSACRLLLEGHQRELHRRREAVCRLRLLRARLWLPGRCQLRRK